MLEAVLLSTTPAFAEGQLQENPPVGKSLKEYHQNIDQPLSAILTLNTIAHTAGAIGVGAQATAIWGASFVSTIVVPVVMTLAILILSEIIPKTLGAIYWKELAAISVKILQFIILILKPFVVLSKMITGFLLGDKKKSALSRADFTAMADLGVKEGVINSNESSMLRNFMGFSKIHAEDVMTPRTVLIAAQEDQTLSDFHKANPDLRFSRIPVYSTGIDKITGYFLRDDLLAALVDDVEQEPVKSLARELVMVTKTMPLTELFDQLVKGHSHIALVVDEFGGTAGVVTVEDVIETLLGMEIVDELDDDADMQALAREQWRKRAAKMGLYNDESEGNEAL